MVHFGSKQAINGHSVCFVIAIFNSRIIYKLCKFMRIQHYDEMCPMCVLKIVQRVSMDVSVSFSVSNPLSLLLSICHDRFCCCPQSSCRFSPLMPGYLPLKGKRYSHRDTHGSPQSRLGQHSDPPPKLLSTFFPSIPVAFLNNLVKKN